MRHIGRGEVVQLNTAGGLSPAGCICKWLNLLILRPEWGLRGGSGRGPGPFTGLPPQARFDYHAEMSRESLSPLQAAWLSLEAPATPMHMGGLLYFRLPKAAKPDFVQRLADQMRAQPPQGAPWTRRLQRAPGPFSLARWVTDARLDIDYHFRHSALPAPGGERQIGELVSRLHGHPMDLSKPLWEVHLIEGLAGGRFALYIKLHSIAFDGAATMDLLKKAFVSDSRKRRMPPLWTLPLPASTPSRLFDDWPALLRALGHRLRAGLQPSLTWTRLKGVPRSALNDRFNGQRRFATQHYELSRLQPLAEAVGVSVEVLLLYLCASALRRFFKEFNALPEMPLVALIADRSRGDGQLSPLFISLGTHQASRRRRLDEIRDSLRLARQQFAVLPPEDARAEGAVDSLPYLLRQALGIDHHLAPMFNLGIAQLSLGDETRYLNGAQLESVFPMPMLLQGGALNIAFMRYAKSWSIGLCGARDNLPHLQRMAVYMGLALDELEEAFKHDQ